MNSRNLYSSFEVSDSTELEGKREDYLTNETPIAISYNGISHVVMMATPNDLEDFAIGFSFSEGIVQSKDDIFDIQIRKNSNGTEINLEIDQENFINLKNIKRNLSGKTGCGICGVESLDYFSDRLNRLYPSRNEILLKKDIIFKSLSYLFKPGKLRNGTKDFSYKNTYSNCYFSTNIYGCGACKKK